MLMTVEVIGLQPGMQYTFNLGGKFTANGGLVTLPDAQALSHPLLPRKKPMGIRQPFDEEPHETLAEELAIYQRFAANAHAEIIAAGLKAPQGLWGLQLLHSLDTENLCSLLDMIPAGCWELMTHPGYPCKQGRPFEGPQRLVELQALRSAEAQAVIARRGIRLCTFGDLACAS